MSRWRRNNFRPRGIGLSVIAAASLSRVCLAAAFAVWVVLALTGTDAARLYQLMFLQGGLIALLSASAYARGAHLASTGVATGATTLRFLKFLSLSSVLAFVLGVAFVPTSLQVPESGLIMGAFVIGAAASAFNGLAQGVVVARVGPVAAFAPSVAASLVGGVVLGGAWVTDPEGLALATLIWVLPQVLTPCLLLRSQVHRRILFERGAKTSDRTGFALTGSMNAGTVAAGFLFRERWADASSGEIAGQGFMIVRITELAYQVFYMGAASFPRHVQRLFTARLARSGGWLWFMGIAMMTSLPVVAWSLLLNRWSAWAAVAAEAMLIPARLLAVLCLLTLLARPTTWAYQWSLLASIVAVLAIMWVPALQDSVLALQALQAVNAGAIVTATALTYSPISRRFQSPSGKRAGTDGD